MFHSSPVLVHPPTAEAACNLGTDNQCVRTIYGYTSTEKYLSGYQTPLDSYSACTSGASDVDAYRAWRSDSRARESAVLVGSNDGFLHAFDAGGPDTSTSSTTTASGWAPPPAPGRSCGPSSPPTSCPACATPC